MSLNELLKRIRACSLCADMLPQAPNPILRATTSSHILLVGQAPGIRVHRTGIPWNDPSGDRLRHWLNIDRDTFYDESKIAIIPMGFCYPGTGPSGDHPPRKECAKTWLTTLLQHLPNIQLTLLIGQYAQTYYLGALRKSNLTQTVQAFKSYLPKYIPLPHPSPRNNIWLHKNLWFEKYAVPIIRERFHAVLAQHF